MWSPSSHRWVAHKDRALQQTMIQLLMIRNTMCEDGTVPWLPNELMFEIFRALFNVSGSGEQQRHTRTTMASQCDIQSHQSTNQPTSASESITEIRGDSTLIDRCDGDLVGVLYGKMCV